MKITHFLIYCIGFVFWVLTCTFTLLVPLTLYVGIAHEPGILIATVVLVALNLLMTMFWGGFNTVPSLFWRFRRNIDTRIIEIEGMYAAQFRLIGNLWMYIDATTGDLICTAWNTDLCAHNLHVNTKKGAEVYLDNFAKEINQGLKTQKSMPEVLSKYQIVDGERVKK